MKLYFFLPYIFFCEFKKIHTDKCLILLELHERDYDSALKRDCVSSSQWNLFILSHVTSTILNYKYEIIVLTK